MLRCWVRHSTPRRASGLGKCSASSVQEFGVRRSGGWVLMETIAQSTVRSLGDSQGLAPYGHQLAPY